ncbi:MAG: hypothetical protein ACYTBJ_08710 [Planctomycetota bacterium]|jgi:hypothetical protein
MAGRQKRKKRRWKSRLFSILMAVLFIVIAGFVFFRLSLKSKIRQRMDAIRAAGYPATCAELDKWYALPEGAENAAYTIMEAFSHFVEWQPDYKRGLPVVGEADLPDRTESLPPETLAFIAEYLADNHEALVLLHDGAALEYCRYPVDFSLGNAALMPYLNEIRKGARLLELEAIHHVARNDPELTTRSIASILGLAKSLSREPVLISQLVRHACLATAVEALEYAVNRSECADEQLEKLGKALAQSQDLAAMSRGFVGERCFGIELFTSEFSFQEMAEWSGGGDFPPALLTLYRAAGLCDGDAIIYLDIMADYIRAGIAPEHERRKAADAADPDMDSISRIRVLLRKFMPALARVMTLDLANIALLRAAEAGLAVERYQLATGTLPDNLAELVPKYLDAVPKDPFDAEDLRYRKLEKGFVVYSIGENEADDDGAERPPPSARRKGGRHDVTFIVER